MRRRGRFEKGVDAVVLARDFGTRSQLFGTCERDGWGQKG